MARLRRPCLRCGSPTIGTYCSGCSTPGDPHHRRPGTADRYGPEYQRIRTELLADDPPCWWGCGRPATTADHVVAQVDGGTHHQMVPACQPCNSSRGAATAIERRNGCPASGT